MAERADAGNQLSKGEASGPGRSGADPEHPLRLLLESTDQGVYGLDAEGRCTFVNRAAAEMLGYAAEELVGRPMHPLVHYRRSDGSDYSPQDCSIYRAFRRGEGVRVADEVYWRKDGTSFPVEYSSFPLREGGAVCGAVVAFADATERLRTQELLRASAERLELALAAAQLGDWSWDAASDAFTLSPRAAEIFGIPPEPPLTWARVQGLIHPGDRERTRFLVEGALADRGPYEAEYRVRRPDGAEVWVSALGRASYSPDGRALGMFGVVQDVTARKRQEEALREEAQTTETLYRIGSALVAELDLQRLVQTVTDEATRLTRAQFGAFFYSVHDERGEAYTLYTLSGAPREAFERFPMPRKTAIFAPTFDGEATVRIGDVTLDPRFGRNAPHQGLPQGHLPVRSYLATPVRSRSGEVLGGLFFGHPHPGVFCERDERLVEGIAAQAAVAIDNARLFESVQRQRARAEYGEQVSRFLAEASATLACLVDYESTLQKIARLAVPRFADWVAVDIADEAGTLRRLAVAHAEPAKVELARELGRRYPPTPDGPHGAYRVLRTARPERMAEIADEMLAAVARDGDHLRLLRELGLKSYVCVPLTVRGKTLGVLTFVSAESGRRYSEADLAVAEDLAHRSAVAIENAVLYRELREADRRKDEFLAMLAHELRNPLAPVRNGLQILRLSGDDRGATRQAREMMERQVGHLVRLVDDLMDVSRIMRGKVDLRREPVELAAVVARAVETAQPAIDAAGHELTVSLPAEPLWVFGDVVRLTQVVSNLLVNACKYSDRAGRILVAGVAEAGVTEAAAAADARAADAPGGAGVVLRVRDTGVGIAKEDLARIFDLFAQVDRSLERTQGGLGIGLTLVKSLVEMHGGTVEAHSDGPGTGSEFTIRLPALGAAPAGPAAVIAGGAAAGRILIVDDNVDAAESLATILRLLGHEAVTAYDGAAALAVASMRRPDVVLLDIGMPGMNGYEVAERLRREAGCGGALLVAMTGYGQEEDRRRSREAGFDHHLVKPVAPEDLEQLLARARPAVR